MGQKVMIRFW